MSATTLAGSRGRAWRLRLDPLIVLLVALLILVGTFEPRFFTRLNLINVARNASLLTLVAIGQTLVMVVGGFDLSIGATMALASVIGALGMLHLGPMLDPVALAFAGAGLALLAGTAVGLANGAIVLALRVNPFMSTLGMASVNGGLAYYLTKGVPIYGLPDAFSSPLARGSLVGIPVIVWFGLAAVAVFWAILDLTAFGRHVYAIGGNPKAARASGVRAWPAVTFAYGSAGLLGAVAGLLLTARIGSGQANIGVTSSIESIAAAVVGGVALTGGVGKIWRVMVASVFLTIIANGLNLVRIDSKWQTLVLGLAIVSAALADRRGRRGGRA